MELTSESFVDGARADDRLALCVPGSQNPVEFGENRSPHLRWEPVEGGLSYVVTCIDPDCPSVGDDVNQSDREVPASLPRVDFVHWLLADIPPSVTEIAEGTHSAGLTAGGKDADASPVGVPGRNDYTDWFADDAALAATWVGYDGPAPPWNDSIVHRYVFTVRAMDVPTLHLAPGFDLAALVGALDGHVLDEASISTSYTLTPRLR